jgi:hypothetical protein
MRSFMRSIRMVKVVGLSFFLLAVHPFRLNFKASHPVGLWPRVESRYMLASSSHTSSSRPHARVAKLTSPLSACCSRSQYRPSDSLQVSRPSSELTMLPALEVSLDPHPASAAPLLPARSASFQMVRSPPPPSGLLDAPLLGFLAPSAAFGLLRPQAYCSLMSDVRFTSLPSVCSPTDVILLKTESDPRWDTQGLSRRALHPSKTCSSSTADTPHDASCLLAVHNQRCCSHSIQTKTMLRSMCRPQFPERNRL